MSEQAIELTTCPCGTDNEYEVCCAPMIKGDTKATTAEELMRSRYSAYAKVEIDYVHDTTHPDHREDFDLDASRQWAENSTWTGMEIIATEAGGPDDTEGRVEFVAHYRQKGENHKHHELSTFEKVEDSWYFVDGQAVKPKQFIRETPKIKPNDTCPCGSGRKHKKCCMGKT